VVTTCLGLDKRIAKDQSKGCKRTKTENPEKTKGALASSSEFV